MISSPYIVLANQRPGPNSVSGTEFGPNPHLPNMFGMLYQSFGKTAHATELQGLLEKRWNQQEQPIFFVAFILHPKYTALFRSMARFERKLSLSKMVQYTLLYYKKYICDLSAQDAGLMAKEVNEWFHDELPDDQFIMSLPPIHF
jgi:hypothetical protein